MSKKKVLCIFIILIIFAIISSNVMVVFAETQSELQQKQNNLQNQIDETKEEIEQVEQNISENMKQIQKLTTEISEYEDEIDDLDSKIGELEKSIKETQEKLEEAQEQYEKQNKMLEDRLVAMYEAGDTTYLDVLLSSDGLVDFISNYYLVSEITNYDTNLLEQIEKNKNSIQEAKTALETSKEQLDAAKSSKKATANSLKNSQSVKQEQVSNLNESEKALQAELDQYEADKKAIQREIAALAAKSGNYAVGAPSSYGYINPVPGYRITCGWYGYSGHQGADFGTWGINGTPILAAKSGTVVTSTALKNGNGNYRSYGEYIVINHNDGTMTLYAHGQPGSRLVSVGDTVSQGQQIMSVGTTGNSTGPHLHFEVWLNGKRVNPAPYLP